MINAWILQHYALAVWMTTGVNTRRRKPAPFAKLVRIVNLTIAGQIIFTYQSVVLLLGGKNLPDSVLVIDIILVVAVLVDWVLPWLEVRARRESVPTMFLKLSQAQRRWRVLAGFVLFWVAFFSIFFVAGSLY